MSANDFYNQGPPGQPPQHAVVTPRRVNTSNRNSPITPPKVTSSSRRRNSITHNKDMLLKRHHRNRWCISNNPRKRKIADV
ncbi:hypothetical protein BJX76DRAFT_355301 [Aspergillus varians]